MTIIDKLNLMREIAKRNDERITEFLQNMKKDIDMIARK